MRSRFPTLRLPAAFLLAVLVFAGGLALARRWLPEWQQGPAVAEEVFVQRFHAVARGAGITLEPGEPRVGLKTGSEEGIAEDDPHMDRVAPELHTRGAGRGLRARVTQEGVWQEDGKLRELVVDYAPSGQPRSLQWAPRGWTRYVSFESQPPTPEEIRRLALQILNPGESLGALEPVILAGNRGYLAEIRGTSPPEHLQVMAQPGGSAYMGRHFGTLAEGRERVRRFRFSDLILWRLGPWLLRLLAVLGLFVVLLSKGRIDVVNGAVLASITLVASWLPGLTDPAAPAAVAGAFLLAAARAFWVFAVWSAGEAFLRAADPSFTNSLDALRAGRLGPRDGRSLLYGLALGAAVAGLDLAARAAAAALPGTWPESYSLNLPVFSTTANPFGQGISLAGTLVVVIAVARRLLPPRWAPAMAIAAGALLLGPLRLHPFPAELAANLAVVAALVLAARRFGLTTLLIASVAYFLLPAAAFSAWWLDWMPATFAATAGATAAVLAVGLVGLKRPERVEMERLKPPAFMRRLEEERRLRYEMGLLARMQVGLLPAGVPEIDGWQIAARSLLATEAGGDLYDFLRDDAGRLWVAAGDVAGHGYSCAIVHAMTTAALASLITPERTPAEVLAQVDRVLRRGGHRNFATLSLLRLDLDTGEGLFSNAGHPYPLALASGQVTEIEIGGLPLGQGPERRYEDLEIRIPPGGALVLCSDGLFEAVDWSARPYGFDRPREVLRTLETRSADEIVETLLRDWQRHLRSEAPPDDTTVVVVKRAAWA